MYEHGPLKPLACAERVISSAEAEPENLAAPRCCWIPVPARQASAMVSELALRKSPCNLVAGARVNLRQKTTRLCVMALTLGTPAPSACRVSRLSVGNYICGVFLVECSSLLESLM
eukprot:703369-Pelagomonas_calceolata.AAC.5